MGDNAGRPNYAIVTDVFHHDAVGSHPAVAAHINPREQLRLVPDAAFAIRKTVLMLAAQDMNIISDQRVVSQGSQSNPGIGAHVNTMPHDGAGVSENRSKSKAAIRRAAFQGHPVISVAEVPASLAGDQTQKLPVTPKPDIPLQQQARNTFTESQRRDEANRHAKHHSFEKFTHFQTSSPSLTALLTSYKGQFRRRLNRCASWPALHPMQLAKLSGSNGTV